VRKGYAFPISEFKIVFAAARLSLAAAKKKKTPEPESQRLSAHQAAEPQVKPS
jgi:hypothetical protein